MGVFFIMRLILSSLLFFCIFPFFSTTLQAQELRKQEGKISGWQIRVSKDKEQLHLSDILHVTIASDYPAPFEPLLFDFIQEQEEPRNSNDFALVSYKVLQRTASHMNLELTLKPQNIGKLIFAPGFLSFFNGEEIHQLLVPPFSIECVRSQPLLEIMPPLPVHPETAITITKENQALVVKASREAQKESVERYGVRSYAWTLFLAILVGSLGCLLSIWFLIKYELTRQKKKQTPPHPKRNLGQEFALLARSEAPQLERFSQLAQLLRERLSEMEGQPLQGKTTQELMPIIAASGVIPAAQKEPLSALLLRLDAIGFAQAHTTPDEWKRACEQVIPLF